MEGVYDATIAVIAARGAAPQRAAARGHALADERAARQLSQEEKAARATFVVAQRRHDAGAGGASCRPCLTS